MPGRTGLQPMTLEAAALPPSKARPWPPPQLAVCCGLACLAGLSLHLASRGAAAPAAPARRPLSKLWAALPVAWLLPPGASASLPRFSNAFQPHMVLQRDRPIKVWGFGAADGTKLHVALGKEGGSPVLRGSCRAGADGRWELTLPKAPSKAVGESMTFVLSKDGVGKPAQTLHDVTLGDVYLFTGQSNVDLPESYGMQFNATAQHEEEQFAEDMGRKGLLRIMIVPNQVPGLNYQAKPAQELANVPDCRLCPPPFGKTGSKYTVCHCNALRWARATPASIRGFSALAWFSGAALVRTMGSHSLKGIPLGLVRSSWGGTKIYRWSSPDALAKCPQPIKPQVLPSTLFSNMIWPLAWHQYSAIVWMHGASDTGKVAPFLGPDYYACALPAMISDWRVKFKQDFPFVVVELPAYCNERDWATFHTFCDQERSILRAPDYHLPAMRIAQAAAETLPQVYMVTAMDLGSLHPMGGSIHSDRKMELGQRVALAARSAVYNETEIHWEAPTAISAAMVGPKKVSVQFATRSNEFLVLNASLGCPKQILPIYCTGSGFELRSLGQWRLAASATLGEGNTVVLEAPRNTSAIDRVRYAYADWPVCSLRSAGSGLPARIFDIPVSSMMLTPASGPSGPSVQKELETAVAEAEQAVETVERDVEPVVEEALRDVHDEEREMFRWPSWSWLALLSGSVMVCVVLINVCSSTCKPCPPRKNSLRVIEVEGQEEESSRTSQSAAPLMEPEGEALPVEEG